MAGLARTIQNGTVVAFPSQRTRSYLTEPEVERLMHGVPQTWPLRTLRRHHDSRRYRHGLRLGELAALMRAAIRQNGVW